jgi:hypothetical protein
MSSSDTTVGGDRRMVLGLGRASGLAAVEAVLAAVGRRHMSR